MDFTKWSQAQNTLEKKKTVANETTTFLCRIVRLFSCKMHLITLWALSMEEEKSQKDIPLWILIFSSS